MRYEPVEQTLRFIKVVRMKLETLAWLQERSRHPTRRKPKQATGILERPFGEAFDVLRNCFEPGDGIHAR